MKKTLFAGLRSVFPGTSVHTIVSAQLDNDFSKKPELVRIASPVVLATIKSVVVNEIKAIKLSGGRDGLAINGGVNGLTFAENDSLIKESAQVDFSQMNGEEPTKKWFGDISIARDVCNASNEGEIIRLGAIIEQCKMEIQTLKDINIANDNAVLASAE